MPSKIKEPLALRRARKEAARISRYTNDKVYVVLNTAKEYTAKECILLWKSDTVIAKYKNGSEIAL